MSVVAIIISATNCWFSTRGLFRARIRTRSAEGLDLGSQKRGNRGTVDTKQDDVAEAISSCAPGVVALPTSRKRKEKSSGSPRGESAAGARPKSWLFPVLIILAGVVYLPSLDHPFIFDDYDSIIENEVVRGEWPLIRAFVDPPPGPTAGRPVVCLSFVLNRVIGDLSESGYRFFNIVLHVCCSLLLYGLIRRSLERTSAGRFKDVAGQRLAGIASLIWLLHPLQTESVTYISQRTEMLMGFFLLGTLYSCRRGVDSTHRGKWFALAVVCCALGMGCKEVMAVAPILVLLYDRIFIAGTFRSALGDRRVLHILLFATWGILAFLIASGPRSDSVGFEHGIGALDYLYTQAGVITWYLRLSIWPSPLVVVYDDWPIAQQLLQIWPFALFILALLIATTWALVRRPAIGFVGAWFFLILGPSSSFVPIATEIAAERRMYLPLASVVVLMVVGSWWLFVRLAKMTSLPNKTRNGIAAAAATAIIVTASAGTVIRNRDYRSRLVIWEDVVAKSPQSAVGQQNLGAQYYEAERYDDALSCYLRALEIRPKYAENLYGLGLTYTRMGDIAKAAESYELAVATNPQFWKARANLANSYHKLGRLEDAVAFYRTLLAEKPTENPLHANLGTALMKQGKLREAVAEFCIVLATEPDHAFALENLGDTLLQQGSIEQAADQYARVIRLTPTNPNPYYKLGTIRQMQGRLDEAVELFQATIRINPQDELASRRLQMAIQQRRDAASD